MEKIAVRTTGPFMLRDPISLAEIYQDTTDPVLHTTFVNERLATKELELLDGELPEDLDEQFPKITSDEPPVVENADDEPPVDPTNGEPLDTSDKDGDGHNDKTGNFVEGNKARTKRGK